MSEDEREEESEKRRRTIDVPGIPQEDIDEAEGRKSPEREPINQSRPEKGHPWGLFMLNRPLYLSFWILLVLAFVGATWLVWLVLPGYSAFLVGLIITTITGGVLKESFIQDPPYRF